MEHSKPAVVEADQEVRHVQSIHGPLAWNGKDVRLSDNTVTLQPDEVDEVEGALKAFKDLGLDFRRITAENFPLPGLGPRLKDVAVNIHAGTGFNLIRGLDPARYSVEDFMIMYMGITSHIGSQRGVQNRRGDMISHIIDAKHWTAPHEQRHGIHTNSALPFHCDVGAEILALLCREAAQHGGHTSLVSSWTIYNEMAKHHPEELEALMRPDWPIQTSGQPLRYITAPLVQRHDDKIIAMLDPGRLGLHPATASAAPRPDAPAMPALSALQQRALAALAGLAAQLAVAVAVRPGDMLLVNNYALLHARAAYEDGDDDDEARDDDGGDGDGDGDGDGRRRHLVRLWLRSPAHSWSLPEDMKALWEPAYGDCLGRFLPRRYPVVPEREYKVPKYTSGSAAWAVEDPEELEL